MAKFRNTRTRDSKTLKRRNSKKVKRRNSKKVMRSKSRRSKIFNYGGSSQTIIIMMWMIGCGHCDLLKGTWDTLKTEMTDVKFIDMESRNLDYELLKKYNIESPRGFPTLVKIKNGVVCDEPPSREIDKLRMWINS
jgi:thiol-disulfide isomerase/thioredoxin